MKTLSLLGFVAELALLSRAVDKSGTVILEKAARVVRDESRSWIGDEHSEWPALAPATIADETAKGFPAPKPLLRTGELRDSIEYTVGETEAAVGSNSDKAVWHELGTSRVPPRSSLRAAAMAVEPRIHRMAAATAVAVLSGGDVREPHEDPE